MNLLIDSKKIFFLLLIVNIILLTLNISGLVYSYSIDSNLSDKVATFDFNTEFNVPTFYSSLLFFINSLLLIIIGFLQREKSENYFSWLSLSLIFLFLAFDETIMIHERFSNSTRELFSTSGLLFFAWIIPYGVFALAGHLIFLKLFLKLPKRTQYLFVLSSSIFLIGALGFEMLGGRHAEIYTRNNLTYAVYYTIEEFLEMMGLTIFIYALLDYIKIHFGNQINIKLK